MAYYTLIILHICYQLNWRRFALWWCFLDLYRTFTSANFSMEIMFMSCLYHCIYLYKRLYANQLRKWSRVKCVEHGDNPIPLCWYTPSSRCNSVYDVINKRSQYLWRHIQYDASSTIDVRVDGKMRKLALVHVWLNNVKKNRGNLCQHIHVTFYLKLHVIWGCCAESKN